MTENYDICEVRNSLKTLIALSKILVTSLSKMSSRMKFKNQTSRKKNRGNLNQFLQQYQFFLNLIPIFHLKFYLIWQSSNFKFKCFFICFCLECAWIGGCIALHVLSRLCVTFIKVYLWIENFIMQSGIIFGDIAFFAIEYDNVTFEDPLGGSRVVRILKFLWYGCQRFPRM